MNYKSKKIIASVFSSALLFSSIIISGPFEIYHGNISSFNVPLITILGYLVIPMVLGMTIFMLIGIILSDKAHQRFVVVISSIGILLWFQGNFLVWDYGVLDGSAIDWSNYNWQGWVDSAIWVVFIGFAIVYYRRTYKHALFVILVILFLQFVTICVNSIQYPKIWKNGFPLVSGPPEEIFEFSTKQNVLHIILDQFGSPLFEEIINDNDFYSSDLQGFTFFKDTIASTPITYLSVPSFLSGQVYSGEESIHEFHKQNYQNSNIHTVLSDHGYELDVMTQLWFFEKRDSDKNHYKIPTPYDLNIRYNYNVAFWVDLALFRYVPHHLKKYVYNNQSWLISSIFLAEESESLRYDHFSGNAFLQEMAGKAIVNRKQPVYKYIHVVTPHPPLVVRFDGQFSGQVLPITKENFRHQAEYTLKNVLKILDKMKLLGLYDSALVIIQSDHGSAIPFEMKSSDNKIINSRDTFVGSEGFCHYC